MSTTGIEIGYVCSRGHFCFYADPDERGECGSKSVGTITVNMHVELTEDERDEVLGESAFSLGHVYETWRTCECKP